MNKNVLDGIIASITSSILSTAIRSYPPVLRPYTQFSLGIAALAFLLLLVSGRSLYLRLVRRLKTWAVAKVLNSTEIEDVIRKNQIVKHRLEEVLTSQALNDIVFKQQMITRVLRDHPLIVSSQNIPVREYENQVACEAEICEAFRAARKIKILTIRGERYFSTSRSLFYELYSSKKEKDSAIQMLVLSPQSNHISEELARKLGHPSAERTRRRMRMALDYLKHLTELNNNFEVRCYNETPYLKILLFDDAMFVSSFTEGGGPKNDHHAKMWQLTREGNPIFIGLERHFDQLWERSIPPE